MKQVCFLVEIEVVARVILEVGVLHADEIARGALEPFVQRRALAHVALVFDDTHLRMPRGDFVRKLPASVSGAVVDDEKLNLKPI